MRDGRPSGQPLLKSAERAEKKTVLRTPHNVGNWSMPYEGERDISYTVVLTVVRRMCATTVRGERNGRVQSSWS